MTYRDFETYLYKLVSFAKMWTWAKVILLFNSSATRVCPALSLSVSLFLYLSVSLSLFLFLFLFLTPSLYLYLFQSFSLYLLSLSTFLRNRSSLRDSPWLWRSPDKLLRPFRCFRSDRESRTSRNRAGANKHLKHIWTVVRNPEGGGAGGKRGPLGFWPNCF